MAERHDDFRTEQYSETTAPQNPPNSVLQPAVRRGAWWLYVFPLIVVCLVAGIALLYWATRDSSRDDNVDAIGTTGEQRQEGGGNPDSRPDSTREEIDNRGGRRE